MDLNALFALQTAFSLRYWAGKGIDITTREGRLAVLRENALGAHTEVDEMLRAVSGWKPHRAADPAAGDPNLLLEEGVDVIKFVLGILVAYGFTAEDFATMYEEKSALVEARLFSETALLGHASRGTGVLVLRAEGLLYDDVAALDAAEGGPGAAALLPPARLEKLRRELALSGALFEHALPGRGLLLQDLPLFGLPVVVLSTAPDTVRTLPRLLGLCTGEIPVFVGRPEALLRYVPVLAYVDTDPAAANAARREGVSRCYVVGGERVRRAAAPGVTAVETVEDLLAAEAAATSPVSSL